MIGNVWEWTADWYTPRHPTATASACCVPRQPARRDARSERYDPGQPARRIPRKVLKGGSHLCAPNYCLRYRPAARQGDPIDTRTSHIGFRCIVRPDASDKREIRGRKPSTMTALFTGIPDDVMARLTRSGLILAMRARHTGKDLAPDTASAAICGGSTAPGERRLGADNVQEGS